MSNASHSLVFPRTFGLVVFAAGTLVVAAPTHAQFTSAIDLSSRSTERSVDGWQSGLAVSPFLRFDHRRVAIDGRWTATGGDGERLNGFGNVRATYYSPTAAGLQLSMSGFADRTQLTNAYAVSELGTDARLSYRLGHSGFWLGKPIVVDNKSTPISPNPDYSGGAWRQVRNAVISLSISSFGTVTGARGPSSRIVRIPAQAGPGVANDSMITTTVPDSGSAGTRHDWRDAELGINWGAGRLAFQALVGTRFSTTNQPNELWGQAQGSLALAGDVALIAATGLRPSSAAYGVARSRFVELGFRVSPTALRRVRLPSGVRPTAAAFQIQDATGGSRTLRVRVPDARSVELSGDFTSWKPIVLKRGDADQWETTLPIAPGMHRLAIRVNGEAWTTPPGVATVADEFQGKVGVIVVK